MDTVDLEELLTSWNLSHIYNTLCEHHINTDNLRILEPHHIRKIFFNLPAGDEALFEFKLRGYKEKYNHTESVVCDLQNPKPSCSKITSSNYFQNKEYSISHILNETKSGRMIMHYYKQHNALHEEQRHLLVNTIATFLQEREIECSISQCSDLEIEICSIFPTETVEFYKVGKRGKIYNKLANLKRVQRGVLHLKNSSKEEMHSIAYVPDDNCLNAVKILRTESINAEEIDIYWTQCAQLRFRQMAESETTREFLKLWPEYSQPSGVHLIEIDFNIKFPMAKDFKSRWLYYEPKIHQHLKNTISSSFILKKLNLPTTLSSDQESKTFSVLWYLHHSFPPHQKVASDKEGAKFRKKFSITDSQESFALIATTQEELDAKIKLLKLQNKNIQPRILIVGDVSNVKSISIFFDDHRYPFLTVLNAVDILFKLFYVFNLQYPEESEIFYNFLQHFLYEIPLKKKFAKISIIKNEILHTDI